MIDGELFTAANGEVPYYVDNQGFFLYSLHLGWSTDANMYGTGGVSGATEERGREGSGACSLGICICICFAFWLLSGCIFGDALLFTQVKARQCKGGKPTSSLCIVPVPYVIVSVNKSRGRI